MSKILIISEKTDNENYLANLLNEVGYEILLAHNKEEVFTITIQDSPDIALIDTCCPNINVSGICKKLKLQNQTNDIQTILLTSGDSSSQDILVGADGYITKPFNESILIATINAHLRIKKLLDILYTNNSELAKSLYQLNVLYNTSSQLAGTLDKAKLVSIMNTGLEKSLNFSMCIALIINNPEDATLIINSQYPLSDKLQQSLKMRSIIGYKSLFDVNNLPFELSIDNITVEQHFKSDEKVYDLNVLSFDSLFSPISTSDKFFGIVEILRELEFSGEDSTCFQTVVNQVSLPLESAILYEEIKKTNAKLEKLEKLKSEFISIVSHELRTPLTAIKNSLDIMLTGKTGNITGVQNNFLSLAKRNVDRLSGIINDLLDFSKIEAGKMEYRFEPVNICDPLVFVKSTFENLAEKKNIDFVVDVDANLPKIYGDVRKIEQILSNLVSNAVKFTPENGKIRLSAEKINTLSIKKTIRNLDKALMYLGEKEELKGDYIRISVEDNGIGIKKEDIPKVFDKFQQIENSLNREVGGTGLGIPIAKQLIEAHRGTIWLESEQNIGSKFSFILPVMINQSAFLLELDNQLQQAKYNHSNLVLFTLKEKSSRAKGRVSLVKDIQEGKINFQKKTEKFKYFIRDNVIQVILPSFDSSGMNNFVKRFKKLIQDNNNEYSNCDIYIGISTYPEQAITSKEMVEQAEKSMKSLIN